MDERPDDLAERIGAEAERKIARRRTQKRSAWRGLAFFGLVGWTIAIPTLAGAALGFWLDGDASTNHLWTLTLMIAGLTIGCASAWASINAAEQDDE